jgi:hypothetical protein
MPHDGKPHSVATVLGQFRALEGNVIGEVSERQHV